MERLMKEGEVAKLLHITAFSVRERRLAGQITALKLGSHCIRYRLADVEAYLQRCAIPAVAPGPVSDATKQ